MTWHCERAVVKIDNSADGKHKGWLFAVRQRVELLAFRIVAAKPHAVTSGEVIHRE